MFLVVDNILFINDSHANICFVTSDLVRRLGLVQHGKIVAPEYYVVLFPVMFVHKTKLSVAIFNQNVSRRLHDGITKSSE